MSRTLYSMSFTTATLRVVESVLIAELYGRAGDWGAVRDTVLSDNLLQMRTLNSSRRVCRELISRLRLLTPEQLKLVVSGSQQERGYLLWLAVCRRYCFVRDFAVEVLRDRFVLADQRLDRAAYDTFFSQKAAWHAEVARVAVATRRKQGQFVYKMLREAGLLGDANTIVPALLTPRLIAAIRADTPADFAFFTVTDADIREWTS
jgi:hypothetical protein